MPRKDFSQRVWEALHPTQLREESRQVTNREAPRWLRLEARRREEKRLARLEGRRLLKKKFLTHLTPEDWEARDRDAEWQRAERQRTRIETRRWKQIVSQRYARDRAVLRLQRRRAERAKRGNIPPRATREINGRNRSAWTAIPILDRPFVALIAKMQPGTWYSRAVLRTKAPPGVAENWACTSGRPYLDRGRIPTPDKPHGFQSLWRLNTRGESLRADFWAAKSDGG
jgi:hypothetical protein